MFTDYEHAYEFFKNNCLKVRNYKYLDGLKF
jgi:hypothetical protein